MSIIVAGALGFVLGILFTVFAVVIMAWFDEDEEIFG